MSNVHHALNAVSLTVHVESRDNENILMACVVMVIHMDSHTGGSWHMVQWVAWMGGDDERHLLNLF